jgi:hypothetical protein
MRDSRLNKGVFAKVRDYVNLVRRLVNCGHDAESIEMAHTILCRSEQKLPTDSDITRKWIPMCGIDDFIAVQRLLKDIEGPDGAALDGGGAEPDLTKSSRRFGTAGAGGRAKAFIAAARALEHFRSWHSKYQSLIADRALRDSWRGSPWFPVPFADAQALIFQPLLVMAGPSQNTISRAADALEQLCSPSIDDQTMVGRRSPYAGALLLNVSEEINPALVDLLKAVIKTKRNLTMSGWVLSPVTVVALGEDPVTTCLQAWRSQSDDVSDFARQWKDALSEPLGEVLNGLQGAISSPIPWEQALRTFVPADVPLTIGGGLEASAGYLAWADDPTVRVLGSRMESLHLVAELLWKDSGALDPLSEVMDRARLQIAIPEDDGTQGLSLDKASLETIYALPMTSAFYSGPERESLIDKWSQARAEASSGDGFVYVFPHIPKTAGSSVHFHLLTHLEYDRSYIHIPIDFSMREEMRIRQPFTLRDARDRSEALVLFGHGVAKKHADFVPGRTLREITTLRDPAERMLSHYNFWMNVLEKRGKPLMSFEDWYAAEPKDYQIRWIAETYLQTNVSRMSPREIADIAMEALDSFWLVCTLPTFESDIQLLWDALSLPPLASRQNVSGVTHKLRFEMTDALRHQVIEENALDVELYQHWLHRAEARQASTPSGKSSSRQIAAHAG